MVIHKDDTYVRIATLDTAAAIDLISEDVVNTIGLHMEEYSGPPVAPIGDLVCPIGTVNFEWHIKGRGKTYRNKFAVLDTKSSKRFDILLSQNTINKVGFFHKNEDVWFFDVG